MRPLTHLVPAGRVLPELVWAARHRAVTGVLWAHVPGIVIFALAVGRSPGEAILEVAPVAFAATVATVSWLGRRLRGVAACLGLLTSSAVVVHLSGGYIEMHFHFFVMVTLMAVYQEWTPFLLAIGYVVVHHGTVGLISPEAVFNHSDGIENPLFSAGVHGAFILGLSGVLMVSWSHAARRALLDPLSGLANRSLFSQRVEKVLPRDGRGSPIAVLFIDLDDFKHVNDSLGHATGDDLLSAVAGRLSSCVRGPDTLARLGGDEFVVLLPQTTAEPAGDMARRIVGALDRPFRVGGTDVYQHATIGIAVSGPTASDVDTLLRHADMAMYDAKADGKGRIAYFRPELHAESVHRLQFEGELRRAIAFGQLFLHYQPVLDLSTGEIAGYEALARWQHPVRGAVPPLELFPLAEETGLIVPLGRWVLREACQQFAAWRQQPEWPHDIGLAVNVSATELRSTTFAADVGAALTDAGLSGDRLTLELTETVLVVDSDVAADRMRELKNLGVRIAIDDFGAGYSSLSYLQRLPVDVLKIDRALVSTIQEGDTGSAVMRAALAIGRTLQISTVAEGVEEAEQLARLRAMGCEFAQGFHISHPLTPSAAAAFAFSHHSRSEARPASDVEPVPTAAGRLDS